MKTFLNCILFGDSLIDKFKIIFIIIWLNLRKRININIIKLTIRLSKNCRAITIELSEKSDYKVFRDIFLTQEYYFEDIKKAKTIVDLGSNIGISIAYFYIQSPDSVIYAFEPNPACFDILQKIKDQNPSRIKVFNLAVGKAGITEFFVSKQGTPASSYLKRKPDDEKILIKSINATELRSIVSNIDLLKCDIEGAEEFILNDLADSSFVKNLIAEIHFDLIDLSSKDISNIFVNHTLKLKMLNKERGLLFSFSK